MLFLRALLGLLFYDVLVSVCRFETAFAMVRRWKVSATPEDRSTTEEVCKAVNYACIWYPKHALCLQRSFVTTYLLRRRGVAAKMVIGAKKVPFKAHAWVEVEEKAINEKSDVQATYAVWEKC